MCAPQRSRCWLRCLASTMWKRDSRLTTPAATPGARGSMIRWPPAGTRNAATSCANAAAVVGCGGRRGGAGSQSGRGVSAMGGNPKSRNDWTPWLATTG